MEGKKESWVVFSPGSGAVHAIYFREPKNVRLGYSVAKASLSAVEIQNPQRLRVVGGKVVRYPVLAGI